jgi:hypothetical protein
VTLVTLAMPDSTVVANLPAGYDAYLGYADGDFANAGELAGRFPAANRIILTATGRTLDCDGADIEPGNLTAADGAAWANRKLTADPGSRPVLYASVEGEPGYGMADVIGALDACRIAQDEVRLLSAHYGQDPHICGPDSCRLISVEMDGTQWTDDFGVIGGNGVPTSVDMSMLAGDFFGQLTGTEQLVQELGTVQAGQTGEAVKTVQGLCVARGATGLAVDGIFGKQTLSAVKFTQSLGKVTVDGIVGAQTWPVLLAVA